MSAAGVCRRVAVRYAGPAALRRWAHLILGGALLTPFWFVANVVSGLLVQQGGPVTLVVVQFVDYLAALPLVALAAFAFPTVRPLQAAVARALLDAELPESAGAGSRSRTAAWCVLHLGLGALVAGATLATPPAIVLLAVRPFAPHGWAWVDRVPAPAGPIGAALLLVVLLGGVRGASAVLVRTAPALLGPSAADRLAAAERRSERLAERNRLARELHDSVGHALSVVTLQAAAAGRVLDAEAGSPADSPAASSTGTAFARSALSAIEDAARGALDELDHVLGLLREEEAHRSPPPDLRDLDRLVTAARAAGAHVAVSADRLAEVPPTVSREAYRIVQEGLTNALKHAPAAPVRLALAMSGSPSGAAALRLTVANALPVQRRRGGGRANGGRGLHGVRERAALLGGVAKAGPRDGDWLIEVTLPWGPR